VYSAVANTSDTYCVCQQSGYAVSFYKDTMISVPLNRIKSLMERVAASSRGKIFANNCSASFQPVGRLELKVLLLVVQIEHRLNGLVTFST
jgi:hypothetical protein